MKLLRRQKDPDRFDDLIRPLLTNGVNPFPYGAAGRRYYSATLGEPDSECSFILLHEDRAVAALVCDFKDKILGRFGLPAGWFQANDAPETIRRAAIEQAVGEIGVLLRNKNTRTARILAGSPSTHHDKLASVLLSMEFAPLPFLMSSLDLTQSGDAIERGLRKGHRHQVKWGRENLVLTMTEGADKDIGLLDAYRQLHAEVAGRITRGDASWAAMADLIASGLGKIILSHLDGGVVGGTFIVCESGVAQYGSGAYRREFFDRPITHWPLLAAIHLAKADGCQRFILGDITPSPELGEKELGILRFKRGFSPDVTTGMVWSSHMEADETKEPPHDK